MKVFNILALLFFLQFATSACSQEDIEAGEMEESIGLPDEGHREGEVEVGDPIEAPNACLQNMYFDQMQGHWFQRACNSASQAQMDQVNAGNMKKEMFLSQCYQETNNSCWCDQLVRPNPDSIDTFHCTYGQDQVHQLIHPNEDTWAYAFEAVKIIEEFAQQNIETRIVYNWWRPEPYNGNVGGASGRHPFGTSVDVRFETKDMQEEAFFKLCKMRAQGRIRAIGYYASTALHLGIGDSRANTWGKACP